LFFAVVLALKTATMGGRGEAAKQTPRRKLEWRAPMDKDEPLAIWKELKNIRQLIFQLTMHYEGVQRTLEASMPGFKQQCLEHEKIASDFYSASLRGGMRVIDAAIQRLESV
jgi:hypothetical protein